MTTKAVTVRLKMPVYAAHCKSAGESGMPVSTRLAQLLEQAHHFDQLEKLRIDILSKLDEISRAAIPKQKNHSPEIVLLLRSVAAHLDPQIVTNVHVKLASRRDKS